jgi:hypothetical protein
MPLTNVSEINNDWGICGFASSIAALYQHGGAVGNVVDTTSVNQLKVRLLAEIKSFLVTLQANGNITMLNGIRDFTRSFAPNTGHAWAAFTIEEYINRINTACRGGTVNGTDFSMAMTPLAVVEYLKLNGGMIGTRLTGTEYIANNVILGVGKLNTSSPHNGVLHWIYKKSDSEVYNWGERKTLSETLEDVSGAGCPDLVCQIVCA